MIFSDFFPTNRLKNGGFTLIELIVVISIIGLLSSVVLASLESIKTKSKYAEAKVELDQIAKLAIVAREQTGKTLKGITGKNCTECGSCRSGEPNVIDMRIVGADSLCAKNWEDFLKKIIKEAEGIIDEAQVEKLVIFERLKRDPWNSPYGLDENEGEFFPGNPCPLDTFTSAGPNGVIYGGSHEKNRDNVSKTIPNLNVCTSQG